MCRRIHRKSDPPCDRCARPDLLRDNVEAYILLCKYTPLMMGDSIKADGIRFVLDEEGYTNPAERLILTRKFIAYLSAANKAQMESMERNAKKN